MTWMDIDHFLGVVQMVDGGLDAGMMLMLLVEEISSILVRLVGEVSLSEGALRSGDHLCEIG